MTIKRLAATLLALLLVLGACGGGEEPEANGPDKKGKVAGKDNKKKGSQGGQNGKGAAIDSDPSKPGIQPPPGIDPGGTQPGGDSGPAGGNTGGSEPPSADKELATASALVVEPEPDAEKQGLPPGYAEALEASIEGLGQQFRITIKFNGSLPDAMPNDKTQMVVGVGLTGKKEDEAFAFGAQATVEGWTAYAGGKGKRAKQFPGTFQISGSDMIMTIPWSYIDGPHAFEWYAHASWFQSLGQATQYSFDPIPNKGPAKFPN